MINDVECLEEGLSALPTLNPPKHAHLHPSEPVVAQDDCRTAAQNSKSKPAAANTQPGPDGRRQANAGSEQSRVCVCGGRGASFKANSGTQLLSGGHWMCVFGGVWPLSDSLHRESSAIHKCIKVSSQRDKNTQRQKRE